MITRGFLDIEPSTQDLWWVQQPIEGLKGFLNSVETNLIDENVTVSEALQIMKKKSIDCLLILKEKYKFHYSISILWEKF